MASSRRNERWIKLRVPWECGKLLQIAFDPLDHRSKATQKSCYDDLCQVVVLK